MKYYMFIGLSLFLTNQLNAQLTFSEHSVSINASNAFKVFALDIDGDSDVDLLSASYGDDKIAWYENDGSENFTEHALSNTADGAYDVYAVDLDNDGDIDVLSASGLDNTIAWYENDGFQNFTTHIITSNALIAHAVYAQDVDGDGDMDVLSASLSSDEITWYENDGSENFTVNTITTTADGAYDVFAVDLDGDSDIDVLSASYSDNTIAWYENDGNEVFTKQVISSAALSARSVSAIDLDGDSDLDVISASFSDNKIAWYENDGSENFTLHQVSINALGAYDVFALDMDGDNDIDLVSASHSDNKIAWYENDGLQNFTEHIISASAVNAHSTYALDIDGDSDMDVLSASYTDNKIAWYENTTCIQTSSVDNVEACNSYSWMDGNVYTASNNTATYTTLNAAGCDSIITLNLTLNSSSTGIDVQTACDVYEWIDGNVYTASNNTATYTMMNAVGCDSVITLNLTVNTVNSGITNNSPVLNADASSATYQWFDCNNDMIISGETNQNFTASVNGNYAVIVSENGCVDTSFCEIVANVNIDELNMSLMVEAYPNPSAGNFMLSGLVQSVGQMEVIDELGRQVSFKSEMLNSDQMRIQLNEVKSGMVYITIVFTNGARITKVVSINH